jgi:hypothetical protein
MATVWKNEWLPKASAKAEDSGKSGNYYLNKITHDNDYDLFVVHSAGHSLELIHAAVAR